jgi:hypothetical protein
MKITSYNHHCSAPFFRALVVYSCQVYSVKGADGRVAHPWRSFFLSI